MIRTPYPYKASLALGIIAALGAAGSAHAQTFGTTVVAPSQVLNYTVATDANSPTFNRPGAGAPPTALSRIGTSVAYATDANPLDANTTSFVATTSGVYNFASTALSGYDDSNFEQFLYAGAPSPFIPASPLTNVQYGVLANGSTTSFNYNVTAGMTYQLVNTGFYNANDTTPGHISIGTSTTTVTNLGSQTNIPDPTRTIIPADPVTSAPATAVYTPTPISQTLSVTDPTTITSFNGITIVGLSHPVIGDLLCTLSHNGTTVDLFDHTGANSSNYNQGSQASFNGGNYTFSLSGADLSAVPDFTDAPNSTYKATSNTATGFDTMNTANTLNSFVGMSAAGAWTLTFTDEQPDDTGSFLGFNFTINQPAAAPEPSQYAAFGIGLLGLGTLALRARRRSRTA